MVLKSKGIVKINSKDDNIIRKYISYLTPLVIIFSSIKLFGYSSSFLFFIPFLFKRRKEVLDFIKTSTIKQRFVLIYFIFLILESLFGAYYIRDLRIIIYWIPFFMVCIFTYFHNIKTIENNTFYKENIINILYYSSVIYFIFYAIMNIISYLYFGNQYDIQNDFWIGSSGAFHASSILLISLYNKWEKINFNIKSNYTLTLIFFISMVALNDSRLGLLYILSFTTFTIIKCLSLRKVLNAILILAIVFNSYSLSSKIIQPLNKYFNNTLIFTETNIFKNFKYRNIFKDLSNMANDGFNTKKVLSKDKKLTGNDSRFLEIIIGLDKFQNTPLVNKMIGTGWYSSRITINSSRNRILDEYKELKHISLQKQEVVQMQGIVAILLDTGILGLFFILGLYLISFLEIFNLRNNFIYKLFISSMLFFNFFCLFIGYPLVNLAFILFLLPDGLLHNLSKINIRKSN